MAKKTKKAQRPPRELTRRQLSRWQQQQKRQRIIFIAGTAIIAAVLIIIGLGWYLGMFRPNHQTAIKVNDKAFNTGYYVDMLSIYGSQQPGYVYQLTDSVIEYIEETELIRQAALDLGFSVDKDKVDTKVKELGLPVNNAARDIIRRELLQEKLLDDYFDSRVPTTADQTEVMAMFLESQSQAQEIRGRLEAGEDFSELAGELSLTYVTKTQSGDIGWHPQGILSGLLGSDIPADYAFSAAAGDLSQPLADDETLKGVGYWLIEVTERVEDEEGAYIRAMLLGSQDEAEEVRAKLLASENFTTLAKEHSQLIGVEENGGELGLIEPGDMTDVFDGFAFDEATDVSTLSDVLRDDTLSTKGGYWLVEVLDKEADRDIDEDDRDTLKAEALQAWVDSLWEDPANAIDHSFLSDETVSWAVEQAESKIASMSE